MKWAGGFERRYAWRMQRSETTILQQRRNRFHEGRKHESKKKYSKVNCLYHHFNSNLVFYAGLSGYDRLQLVRDRNPNIYSNTYAQSHPYSESDAHTNTNPISVANTFTQRGNR
jgi:hypothetical protein